MRLLPLSLCFLLGCLPPPEFPGGGGTSSTSLLPPSTSSDDLSSSSVLSSTSSTSFTSLAFPEIFCGNGVIEGDEECDDANKIEDDGCNSICARDRYAFVMSVFTSPAEMQGIKLAGDYCSQLAFANKLPNSSSYEAWLSDSVSNAKDRIYNGKGRYLRVDGLEIAKNFEDLLDGNIINPIQITEKGELQEPYCVWTGTNLDGTLANDPDPIYGKVTNCDNWTSSDVMILGYWGKNTETSGEWTRRMDWLVNPTSCAGGCSVYCFEGK